VRARMVGHPRDYRWSSYAANADGAADPLLTEHALYRALGPRVMPGKAGRPPKPRVDARQMKML